MKYLMEELVDLKIGRTPPRKEQCWFKKTSGIKWASIKDIGNSGRFIDNTSEYITKEAVNKFNIPVVNKNTVILSFKLTVGKVSIAKDTMTTNEAIAQLPIKDTKILNPMFLYYYLKNYNFNQLGSTSSIATAINSRYLKRMILDIPSIYKQNKIVDILSSLDNAIENNEKINKNLEEQAKAIYQKMFIDNPDNDWNEGSLSDIANITMGQSPSGSSYNDDGIGTVFFQGRAEFGFRFPTIRLYTTNPKRMAGENDILMSVRAPVGDLNIAHEDCCIGRGLAAICSKTSYQSFILYTMFSLKKQLNVFNGEGTVFGSINRNSLNDMPILIPSDEQIEKFELIVAPMDAAIRNNYDEICRLQVIRDSLLARLMSGEIDVSNLDI